MSICLQWLGKIEISSLLPQIYHSKQERAETEINETEWGGGREGGKAGALQGRYKQKYAKIGEQRKRNEEKGGRR